MKVAQKVIETRKIAARKPPNAFLKRTIKDLMKRDFSGADLWKNADFEAALHALDKVRVPKKIAPQARILVIRLFEVKWMKSDAKAKRPIDVGHTKQFLNRMLEAIDHSLRNDRRELTHSQVKSLLSNRNLVADHLSKLRSLPFNSVSTILASERITGFASDVYSRRLEGLIGRARFNALERETAQASNLVMKRILERD